MSVNIHHLHPDLQAKITVLLTRFKNVRIVQGWRDPAYQDSLHAKGISPLTGLQSLHCCVDDGFPCSRAFDFGVFNADGSYVKDGLDPRYQEVGEFCESLGLRWGGRFKHKDYDHVDMPDNPVSAKA